MANNVASIVTERIIAQLQAGVVPWRRPWTSDAAINYVSRKAYRGINTLLLPQGGEYLTFKQVQDLGGRIKRGSHAHLVVYFKLLPKREATEDRDEWGAIPLLRYYNVFALADTEGIPSKLAAPVEHEPIAEAEAIVAGYVDGPKVLHLHQDRAYYMPTTDTVVVPTMGQFPRVEAFYNVLNHELIHSTGHKTRLDRFDGTDSTIFASESYSKEELIAEIGAAMLASQCGIDHSTREQSAAYISSWIDRLQGDVSLIVSAAGKAQRAVDRILGVAAEQANSDEIAA
jgi:antirestriction protein ArdC